MRVTVVEEVEARSKTIGGGVTLRGRSADVRVRCHVMLSGHHLSPVTEPLLWA